MCIERYFECFAWFFFSILFSVFVLFCSVIFFFCLYAQTNQNVCVHIQYFVFFSYILLFSSHMRHKESETINVQNEIQCALRMRVEWDWTVMRCEINSYQNAWKWIKKKKKTKFNNKHTLVECISKWMKEI